RQTLKGSDAIGFVRFRHDQLGDIGRVQRQEIFMKAVLEKAIRPESWPKIPGLLSLAGEYSLSDLSTAEIASYVAFVKRVPRDNHILMMLPGNFSDSGDWLVNDREKRRLISRFLGTSFIS
ncbi:MAG TPA: LCP family protein, partial [Candidatus Melainabacteria bacterium]|nr:LCP family protein [Candidatus Melainabacteria bacterium]